MCHPIHNSQFSPDIDANVTGQKLVQNPNCSIWFDFWRLSMSELIWDSHMDWCIHLQTKTYMQIPNIVFNKSFSLKTQHQPQMFTGLRLCNKLLIYKSSTGILPSEKPRKLIFSFNYQVIFSWSSPQFASNNQFTGCPGQQILSSPVVSAVNVD